VADVLAAQSPTPTDKKKNRRSSSRPVLKSPSPGSPSLEDLPLGAQELLRVTKNASPAPPVERSARPATKRPIDNYDFGVPLSGAAGGENAREPATDESMVSSEERWRRAVEEARQELREAEEEKQRQDAADSPVSGQDAMLRIAKARQKLRRLLEIGKAKQYREQPIEKPVEIEP
jgi:flagellar hook-basal body complex protein FliE